MLSVLTPQQGKSLISLCLSQYNCFLNLESGAINTWASVRNLLKHGTDATVEGLRAAVIGILFTSSFCLLFFYSRKLCGYKWTSQGTFRMALWLDFLLCCQGFFLLS